MDEKIGKPRRKVRRFLARQRRFFAASNEARAMFPGNRIAADDCEEIAEKRQRLGSNQDPDSDVSSSLSGSDRFVGRSGSNVKNESESLTDTHTVSLLAAEDLKMDEDAPKIVFASDETTGAALNRRPSKLFYPHFYRFYLKNHFDMLRYYVLFNLLKILYASILLLLHKFLHRSVGLGNDLNPVITLVILMSIDILFFILVVLMDEKILEKAEKSFVFRNSSPIVAFAFDLIFMMLCFKELFNLPASARVASIQLLNMLSMYSNVVLLPCPVSKATFLSLLGFVVKFTYASYNFHHMQLDFTRVSSCDFSSFNTRSQALWREGWDNLVLNLKLEAIIKTLLYRSSKLHFCY